MSTKLSDAEIRNLLDEFIEAAEAYWESLSDMYDYSKANEKVDIVTVIKKKLEEGDALESLLPLREHYSPAVRNCAASGTLKLDKQGGRRVLEEIAKGDSPQALFVRLSLVPFEMEDQGWALDWEFADRKPSPGNPDLN